MAGAPAGIGRKLAAAIGLAAVALAGILAYRLPTVNAVRVVIEGPSVGSKFEVFFDVGRGFNNLDRSSAVFFRSASIRTLYFPAPPGVIRSLRLDPLSRPGEVRIISVALGHRSVGGLAGMTVTHEWDAWALQREFTPRLVDEVRVERGALVVKAGGGDPGLVSAPNLGATAGGRSGGLGAAARRRIRLVDALLAGGAAAALLATIVLLAGLVTRHPRLLESFASAPADRLFAALALPFGLCYLLLTPPFQVPDEQTHLFRSYQLATLDIFHPDGAVPQGIVDATARYVPYRWSPFGASGVGIIWQDLGQRDYARETQRMWTPDVVLPYLPQAAGVAIGGWLGSPPLVMMYLGRLLNLVAFVALVAAAIRITPIFKWGLLTLGLMPMSLFLAASLSYDAVTTGMVFLFLALVLRHSRDEGARLGPGSIAALFLAAWGTALVKPPYLMVTAAWFLIPSGRFGSRTRHLALSGALLASTLLAAGTWSLAREIMGVPAFVRYEPVGGIPFPRAQLESMLQAPWEYLRGYGFTVRALGASWAGTMIGAKLGWLDIDLPAWVVAWYAALLPAVALLDAEGSFSPGRAQRLLLSLLAALALVLIPTALYLSDPRSNPVGVGRILGVQGRYFIPLAPLALLCLTNTALGPKSPPARALLRGAVLAAAACCLAAGAASVYHHYYG